jgi:hypothetical protein
MKEVIEKIAEIESMLERDIEWSLTDYVEKKEISPYLTQAYEGLMGLKIVADKIETEVE